MAIDNQRIAVPGWSAGVPDYEANPAMSPGQKTGESGYPRWYDEIIQQWPRARARYTESRAEVASMGIYLQPLGVSESEPDGDESPEERDFNDGLQSLLSERCGVLQGDGPTYGAGEILAWVYDVPWFGFALADPYWEHDGDGDPLREGKLCLVPLLRAAVYRWGVDLLTGKVRDVWYQQAMGTKAIPYAGLIHLTHGGAPGQYFGDGELRPLIPVFSAWREAIRSGADGMRAAKGRLILTEPQNLDATGKQRMRTLTNDFDNGRVDSFSVPFGAEKEVSYPGGSMPDFSGWMQSLDLYCDQLFQSRTSSLGITESGSRATAEVLAGEDERAQISAWDRLVDRLVQRVGAWVAQQVGYKGRIRRGECARVQASESPDAMVDRAIKIREFAGGWSQRDADKLREAAGWISLEEAGVQVDTQEAGGLLVGQVQAAVEIASNPMLSPEIKLELLVSAGVPLESAQRIAASAALPPAAEAVAAPAALAEPTITVADIPGATKTTGLIAELAERCGCGDCSSAYLSEGEIIGRDGKPLATWRGPLTVNVDGVDYQPELSVAWAEIDELREVADAELAAILTPIVDEHRAAVWDALESDGYVQSAQDRLYSDYRAKYEAAIVAYYSRVRTVTMEQAQAERAAGDVRPTDRAGLDPEFLREWSDQQSERARLQARVAAETIASRVQTPVQSAYAGGTRRAAFNPRQTMTGLASEAAPIATRIEAVGTVVDAAEAAPAGQVVIAAVRTSVRDPRVCDWCRSQDAANNPATSWRFPEQRQEFLDYMDIHSLPDSACEGGDRCRCRITLIWGSKR